MGSLKGDVKERAEIEVEPVRMSYIAHDGMSSSASDNGRSRERTYGNCLFTRYDFTIIVNFDNRFVLNTFLHTTHVESIYAIPVFHSIVDPGLAGVSGEKDGSLRGNHQSVGSEVLVSCEENRVEHAFVE